MANALDLLAEDHRRVEQLFENFGETGDEQTAMTICDELTMHTVVEEQLVYPDLRKLDADLEKEGEREHAEAKQLIERARNASGDELVDIMNELQGAVDHHVGEEESEAFPKLEQLGDERLEEIGDQIEQLKARESIA